MVRYPNLVGEIAKHEIKQKAIAASIGVSDRALRKKLSGETPFTWPEVKTIRCTFFPYMSLDELFVSSDEEPLKS